MKYLKYQLHKTPKSSRRGGRFSFRVNKRPWETKSPPGIFVKICLVSCQQEAKTSDIILNCMWMIHATTNSAHKGPVFRWMLRICLGGVTTPLALFGSGFTWGGVTTLLALFRSDANPIYSLVWHRHAFHWILSIHLTFFLSSVENLTFKRSCSNFRSTSLFAVNFS